MAVKTNNKKAKDNPCKKYERAITKYILGEEMEISQAELFTHLRQCKPCRDELLNWQDTSALLKTEAHFNKPEVQKKYQDMLQEIKRGSPTQDFGMVRPVTLPPPRDTDKEIGLGAGAIYDCLKKNGPILIPLIREKTNLLDYPFRESMGWLAREKKITFYGDPKTGFASLNPGEQMRL